MKLYLENLKILPENLELINEFRKVAGYKINTQKLTEFLHTNNKTPKREIS